MSENYRTLRARVILFSKGMAMGTADIIPGVSGGTIALISGIYEHFVAALSSVGLTQLRSALLLPFSLGNRQRRDDCLAAIAAIHWSFLLPLVTGVIAGILIMAQIIPGLMEKHPFLMYSFFFGLILFSITIPFRQMLPRLLEFLLVAIFAVATYFVVGLSSVEGLAVALDGRSAELSDEKGGVALVRPEAGEHRVTVERRGSPLGEFRLIVPEEGALQLGAVELVGLEVALRSDRGDGEVRFNLASASSAAAHALFLAGVISISAMILPGISGAYILVLLGKYKIILEAIHSRDLLVLAAFVAGVVVGIFSFVRVLKFLLARYYSVTMAALTGIMIGSLRKIWPVPYHEGALPEQLIYSGVAIALVGALLVFILERLSHRVGDPHAPR